MPLCADRGKPDEPFSSNPYTDDGYVYRIYNYRHQSAHRGAYSFLHRLNRGAVLDRSASLYLDPRDQSRWPSEHALATDMQKMLDLVETKTRDVLADL